jgi:hypothetical protein
MEKMGEKKEGENRVPNSAPIRSHEKQSEGKGLPF